MKASCQSPTIELELASGRFVGRKGTQLERGAVAATPSGDVGGGDGEAEEAWLAKKKM